jgi:tRNA(adenine34) deaminase
MNSMELALEMAYRAYANDEVPVGAVIYDEQNQKIIAAESNQMRAQKNPLAHAEMLVIQKACQLLDRERLVNYSLYVTLEPCPMCAQAISFARLSKVIFGAYDPKSGGVIHGPRIFESDACHFRPQIIGGVREKNLWSIAKRFFRLKARMNHLRVLFRLESALNAPYFQRLANLHHPQSPVIY